MKPFVVRAVALSLFWIPVCLLSQSLSTVSGRVVDGAQRGVANVQVKLRPPETSKAAVQIGGTDQGGGFSFARVPSGRYLLEVSQGPYVLSRVAVNAPSAPLTVPVQRR